MAESSSPALPGDVEWLPGPEGTWVLRISPQTPEPPALILRVFGGGERRIEARGGPVVEYAIPAEPDWSAAWLQWADGTRAALPLPHGPHAEVIELHPRRFARTEDAARQGAEPRQDARATSAPHAAAGDSARHQAEPIDRAAPASDPARGDTASLSGDAARHAAAPRGSASPAGDPARYDTASLSGDAARHAAAPRGSASPAGDPGRYDTPSDDRATVGDAAAPLPSAGNEGPRRSVPATRASWTTPPQPSDSAREAEAVWRDRRDDLRRELAEAADAISRAREGERTAREAVLAALAAARADLRASRAAREADASTLTAVTGELGAERAAHAVTRGSVGSLADALSTARAELAAAKTRGEATQADLDVARAELTAARANGAAELAAARSDAAQARAELATLRETLEAERGTRERPLAGRGDLGRLAREQADAAAATRRPPEASAQLLASLDAAAAALRAATPSIDAESPIESPESRWSLQRRSARAADDDAPPREGLGGAARESSVVDGLAGAAARLRAATPDGAAEHGGLARAATSDGSTADAGLGPATQDGLSRTADAPTPDRTGSATADGSSRAVDGPVATPDEAIDVDASRDAALGNATPQRPEPTTRPTAAVRSTVPASSELVVAGGDAPLRRALIALAREDSMAAGALLVGLLPAQSAVIEGAVTYDLTLRGVGTFAVFVADGSTRVVRLSRRRPRGQALFHLSAEPRVLAELLVGDRRKVGRFRRKARFSGRRKHVRDLLPLIGNSLSLADVVKAGARLDPGLVYRMLPLAVDPAWTRGHDFTIAQQIVEFAPQAWHITAADGQPLRVVQRHYEARADATVTMSQAAFERMLRNEPPEHGDRPQIRGDRDAVAALKRWTDLARGV